MNIFEHQVIITTISVFLDFNSLKNMIFVNKSCSFTINNQHFWKLKYIYDYNYYKNVVDWKDTYLNTNDVYKFGFNDTIPTKINMKASDICCGAQDIIRDLNGDIIYKTIYYKKINVKYFKCGRDYDHLIYVDNDGIIYGIGKNNYCQVYPGSDNYVYQENKINFFIKNIVVKDIACYNHNLILDKDGNVWTFGMNNYCQLGRLHNFDVPEIVDLPKIISVACGCNHSMVIDEHNNIWGFGRNTFGQLGLDVNMDNNCLPPTNTNIKAKVIQCGDQYSLFIDMDDNVFICGLFYNKTYLTSTPIGIKAKKIACGLNHILLIDLDDYVWSFGSNEQLGLGNYKKYKLKPHNLNMKAREVQCGDYHSMILI